MAKREKIALIHGKTFTSLMGETPRIETKNGVQSTGKVNDGGGLWLIVGKGEQRSWLYRYQFGGKACELNIGSAHKIDLGAAREKRAACEALKDKNIDPRSERVATKAAAKAAIVVRQTSKTLFELAKLAAVDIGPKNPKRQAYWANQLKPDLTAGVGGMAPASITHDDVVRALKAIRERCACAEQSRKVEGQMRLMFEWCAAHGHMPSDAENPAEFTKRQRFRFAAAPKRSVGHARVPVEHVTATLADLRAKEVNHRTLAVEWLVLSVIRASAVTTADWSEIDRAAKVWTVPAAKMKIKNVGAHRIPLTARHLEILDALVAMASGEQPKCGLVFEAAEGGEMTVDKLNDTLRTVYPHLVERFDNENGQFVDMRQACVHGFRTTFRTWGGDQFDRKAKKRMFDETTLELCMAHVVGDAARNAYDKSDNVEARRVVLDAWAAFCGGAKIKTFRAAA
jgi:hypothetical protein